MSDVSDKISEQPKIKTKKAQKSKSAKKPKKGTKQNVSKSATRIVVSAEQLPRKSLEQSLAIAKILREVFSSGPATWDQIAQVMKVNPKNLHQKYPLWAALAYNVIEKDNDNFLLSELGRKILAPT